VVREPALRARPGCLAWYRVVEGWEEGPLVLTLELRPVLVLAEKLVLVVLVLVVLVLVVLVLEPVLVWKAVLL
jgi:hypothetical protein